MRTGVYKKKARGGLRPSCETFISTLIVSLLSLQLSSFLYYVFAIDSLNPEEGYP